MLVGQLASARQALAEYMTLLPEMRISIIGNEPRTSPMESEGKFTVLRFGRPARMTEQRRLAAILVR